MITISIFTSICQKLAILKLKENAEIDKGIMWINIFVVFFGLVYLFSNNAGLMQTTLTDECIKHIDIDPSTIDTINKHHHLVMDYGTFFSAQTLIAMQVLFFTVYTILMLQRTEQFGYIIIMMTEMMHEIGKYLSTFGVFLFLFVVILRLTHIFIKVDPMTLKGAFLDIFDAYFGN